MGTLRVNVHVKNIQSQQTEHPVELVAYLVHECVLSMMWVNTSKQLCTIQPVARFPLPTASQAGKKKGK